jgi:hypothetical protein
LEVDAYGKRLCDSSLTVVVKVIVRSNQALES